MDPTITALIQSGNYSATDHDNNSGINYDNNLSNRVAATFRELSETEAQYKETINNLSQSPQFTSDPQKMALLQNYISEYNNHTALISTLVRKGISTIETLEKAQ